MINTYIINLKESYERRQNTETVLKPYSNILNLSFVEAFDGRNLSDDKLETIFHQNKAFKTYGRKLIGPEIGCTLSHRKCLSKLIESSHTACLIFEDDLVLPTADISNNLSEIYHHVVTMNHPVIVLLSGDYWYTSTKNITDSTQIAKVREAVCSHAYFINKPAAKLILSKQPYTLADDWFSIKKLGINIYAAFPHLADQNRRDLETEISDKYTGFIRKNLSLFNRFKSYTRAIIKRILLYTKHFECKSFIQ